MKSLKMSIIAIVAFSLLFPYVFSFIDSGFTFHIDLFHFVSNIVKSCVLTTILTHIVILFRKRKKQEKQILDLIPQAVVIYDWDGKISFINKYAQKMFEYDIDNVVGKNIVSFVVEKDRQRAIVSAKEDCEKKEILKPVDNFIIKNASGDEIGITMHAASYTQDEVISTLIDNSIIDNAKKMYADQIQFFWSLLNDLPIAMAFLDTRGKHKFINKVYVSMFNSRETQMLGKQLSDFIEAEEFERINKKIQYVLHFNKEILFNEFITINGIRKIVSINIVPRNVGNDGVFILIRDTTSENVKNALLKKELVLNKTLSTIADKLSTIDNKNRYNVISESLGLIRDAVDVSRCYMINKMDDGDFEISYENVVDGLKPYEGFTIDMSNKEKEFYNTFISKKSKLVVPNVTISGTNNLKHFIVFKSKSVLEVSLPQTTNSIGNILGISSDKKYIKWTESDIQFLSIANDLIVNAISMLRKIQDLKLSDETLNTLIDNTEIGIIITDISSNRIHYINNRMKKLFEYDPIENGETFDYNYMYNKLISPDDAPRVKEALKIREYKGSFGGTIKAKTAHGNSITARVYSSRIQYEGIEAYLTTVVDVSEYIKKGE